MKMSFEIHNVEVILNNLRRSIVEKLPFSLIRFGDGGLKLIYNFLTNDKESISSISVREGIPENKFKDIINAWSYYANKADYIDCPDSYGTEKFWPRYKKPAKRIKMSYKTQCLLGHWKDIYDNININRSVWCNPEVNFLSIIRFKDRRKENLLDIIKNKKICCITNHKKFQPILNKHINRRIKLFKIVGWNEDHYNRCFLDVVDFIKKDALKYDLFLIGAGELGRIYTGLIKDVGGRAFDLGTVFDFWSDINYIPSRLENYIKRSEENVLEMNLTLRGMVYEEYI